MLVATHDGKFHPDDVLGCAVIGFIFNTNIIRTRDPEILKKAKILIDVGGVYDPEGLKFDHHMPNGPKRKNGILYSAFGLIWKNFGEACVEIIIKKNNIDHIKIPKKLIKAIAQKIDETFVLNIDKLDNGYIQDNEISLSHLIYITNDNENSFQSFQEALFIARQYIKKTILKELENFKNQIIIEDAYRHKDGHTLLLNQKIDISTSIFPKDIFFVIMPVDENFMVYAIAKHNNPNPFISQYPFQKEFLGLCANINDIPKRHEFDKDFIFIHHKGFCASAKTLESAKKLIKLTEFYKK